MKKKLSYLIICLTAALSFASCTDKSAAEPVQTETTTTQEPATEAPTTEDPSVFDEKAAEMVKSYLKAVVDDGSALSASKLMFPEAIAMKSFPTEDIAREKLFSGMEMTNGVKIGEFKTDKCEQLTDSQLRDAEAYFEKYANVISGLPKMDYTVVNGREISVTAELKDSSGDTQDYSCTYVVVDMGDEGCKVITTTAGKLDGLAD